MGFFFALNDMKKLFWSILALTLIGCEESGATIELEQLKRTTFIEILGATQDGGSPHTGCKKKCCTPLFNNSSIERMVVALGLVSTQTNETWLFEATPDLPKQMHQLQSLINTNNKTPTGIFLTHAHIGHYTGLMFLGREVMNADNVPVYCLPRMQSFLESNGPWSQLVELGNIKIQSLIADSSVQLNKEISITTLSIPHRDEFSETAGFIIQGPNKSALFIPDIDKWEKWDRNITALLQEVDYAFLDATFYDQSEIPGRKMSEIPHPFVVESMQRFSELETNEKSKIIFIHFNHTNPLLERNSEQFKQVIKAGFKIAKRGDRYSL